VVRAWDLVCYPASLLWSPGPRPSPVFRSVLCDFLSLNVPILSGDATAAGPSHLRDANKSLAPHSVAKRAPSLGARSFIRSTSQQNRRAVPCRAAPRASLTTVRLPLDVVAGDEIVVLIVGLGEEALLLEPVYRRRLARVFVLPSRARRQRRLAFVVADSQ